MKKLTPEQARAIRKLVWAKRTHCDRDAVWSEAVDELTAKPGDKEWCGTYWAEGREFDVDLCIYWRTVLFPNQVLGLTSGEVGCHHPYFTPGVCPTGRWEEK